MKDQNLEQKAKRLRWFGISREDKQKGVWENDIVEVGYKYQMTDIGAAIGLAGLEEIEQTINYRKKLFSRYCENLKGNSQVRVVHDADPRKQHAAWLFTIIVEKRLQLQEKLRVFKVESGQTHYRNDRYSIFAETGHFPNMDEVDENYLVLPLHTKVTIEDVDKICGLINSGW